MGIVLQRVTKLEWHNKKNWKKKIRSAYKNADKPSLSTITEVQNTKDIIWNFV